MSLDIRIEALKIASGLHTDIDQIVKAAEKFVAFLKAETGAVEKAAKTAAEAVVDKVKTVETKVVEEVKTVETKVEDINTRVAALAKTLLQKSKPALVAALKALGVERARDIPEAKLPEAEKVFTKAIAEAA